MGSSGSAQVEQVPHVTGHAADTPAREHRSGVAFLATHSQDLTILDPFFFKSLILSDVSTQGDVGAIDGVVVGDSLGDIVGALVGDSEGESVGEGV